MQTLYAYDEILAASQRVNWRIEDLIGNGRRLDFTRPFLPEVFARTSSLEFLSPAEQRTLNQVRGHTYLYLFGFVEEFILPFALQHADPAVCGGDDARVTVTA